MTAGSMSPNLMQHRLAVTLRRIGAESSIPPAELAQVLMVDAASLERIIQGQFEPSLAALCRLAEHLDIDLNCLLNGELPEGLLQRNPPERPGATRIPDRYATPEHQLSLKRSMDGVINFISARHGAHFTGQLLRRLGINDHTYHQLSPYISPLIQTDFIHLLQRAGFPDDSFNDMGAQAAGVLRQQLTPSEVATFNDAQDLLDWLIHDLQAGTDKLFQYSITAVRQHALCLRIQPILERIHLVSDEILAHRPICHFKQGFYKSLPHLFGFGVGRLRETSCLFQGNNSCQYELSWQPFSRRPLLKR